MREYGWTKRQWALKAGITETSITRFMSDEKASIPSGQTIAALSAVVPSMPFTFSQGQPVHYIPVLNKQELMELKNDMSKVRYTEFINSNEVLPISSDQTGLVACVLEQDCIKSKGLARGTTVILDMLKNPEDGNIVVVVHDEKLLAYQVTGESLWSENTEFPTISLAKSQIMGVAVNTINQL